MYQFNVCLNLYIIYIYIYTYILYTCHIYIYILYTYYTHIIDTWDRQHLRFRVSCVPIDWILCLRTHRTWSKDTELLGIFRSKKLHLATFAARLMFPDPGNDSNWFSRGFKWIKTVLNELHVIDQYMSPNFGSQQELEGSEGSEDEGHVGARRAGKWSQSRNKNREGKHQMIQMHKKLPDDCWRAKTPSHSKKLLEIRPTGFSISGSMVHVYLNSGVYPKWHCHCESVRLNLGFVHNLGSYVGIAWFDGLKITQKSAVFQLQMSINST